MEVHSEVHLTDIAGIAVSNRFVEVNGQILATQTGTEKAMQNALAAPRTRTLTQL